MQVKEMVNCLPDPQATSCRDVLFGQASPFLFLFNIKFACLHTGRVCLCSPPPFNPFHNALTFHTIYLPDP